MYVTNFRWRCASSYGADRPTLIAPLNSKILPHFDVRPASVQSKLTILEHIILPELIGPSSFFFALYFTPVSSAASDYFLLCPARSPWLCPGWRASAQCWSCPPCLRYIQVCGTQTTHILIFLVQTVGWWTNHAEQMSPWPGVCSSQGWSWDGMYSDTDNTPTWLYLNILLNIFN